MSRLKPLCLALCCLLAPLGLLKAQEEQQKPQEEIPDFSNIDEYIYVPKTTLSYGFRSMGGTKATFKGNGTIPLSSTDAPGAINTSQTQLTTIVNGQVVANSTNNTTTADASNTARVYHDGTVGKDARTITVDNGDGTTSQIPLNGSDGKTNTWSYDTANQVDANGLMTFSTYQAQTLDTLTHSNKGKGAAGMEIAAARDMGNFGSQRFSWKLLGGASINDISAGMISKVRASVTTTTDTYDLFGQTAPTAPYSAPSSTTVNVVDSAGNQVTDTATGTSVTQTQDTTTPLGNNPVSRTITTATDATTVSNHWKVQGAYFTFRFGPQLYWNITPKLHLVVDAGPALIFAGSNYDVTEILNANTGAPQEDEFSDTKSKAMVGYFADVSLQYDVTDRTGFYVGSYYQDSGKYGQTASKPADSASYTTHVDLTNQSGLRTGLTFKF